MKGSEDTLGYSSQPTFAPHTSVNVSAAEIWINLQEKEGPDQS